MTDDDGTVDVPHALAAALDRYPDARAAWTEVEPAEQMRFAQWVAAAGPGKRADRRATAVTRDLLQGRTLAGRGRRALRYVGDMVVHGAPPADKGTGAAGF